MPSGAAVPQVPVSGDLIKVSAIDSLIQAVAIVFSAAYWVSGFMAIIGITNEHPFLVNLISLDSHAWEQTLRDIGFESIVETWSNVFFVLVRWFGGLFGVISTIKGHRELIVVTLSLSLTYLLLKLQSTFLHIYAWQVTDEVKYVQKAKMDADIIIFDFVFVAICLLFASKLSTRD